MHLLHAQGTNTAVINTFTVLNFAEAVLASSGAVGDRLAAVGALRVCVAHEWRSLSPGDDIQGDNDAFFPQNLGNSLLG
jgi:hypothetical protein